MRQPLHLCDALGARGNHGEAVEAQRNAGTGRHAMGEGGEEVLVERPVGAG